MATIGGGGGQKSVKRNYATIDPLGDYPGEKVAARDYIYGRGGRIQPFAGEHTPATSSYVGPRENQDFAQGGLRGAAEYASPYFKTGVNTRNFTAAGGNLDPTQNPAFRSMQDASRVYAQDIFRDAANQVDNQAAARGVFDSSARQNQRNRAAERVSNQIGNELARQTYQQYGAERGFQEGAAAAGTELAPRLGQQLFQNEEQFRQAEQQANQQQQELQFNKEKQQLTEYLANAGVDQATIDGMLKYLQTVRNQVVDKGSWQGEWNASGGAGFGIPRGGATDVSGGTGSAGGIAGLF